jgi:hypothetical protein
MELTQEEFAAAAACGCSFVPITEAQVALLAMQRRIFTFDGKQFAVTRDAGGFHETHATLALLIGAHSKGEVSSRGDTLQQVAAADAASAKEMDKERGAGGAQEVRTRQPPTGRRTPTRSVKRHE